jgi:hypothetical protein
MSGWVVGRSLAFLIHLFFYSGLAQDFQDSRVWQSVKDDPVIGRHLLDPEDPAVPHGLVGIFGDGIGIGVHKVKAILVRYYNLPPHLRDDPGLLLIHAVLPEWVKNQQYVLEALADQLLWARTVSPS